MFFDCRYDLFIQIRYQRFDDGKQYGHHVDIGLNDSKKWFGQNVLIDIEMMFGGSYQVYIL